MPSIALCYNNGTEADMLKVKGVYDGERVILLEPVTMPPDTKVEVLIPEVNGESEQSYWQRLVELGLVSEIRRRSPTEKPFTPIRVLGIPVSQTIIDERR